MNVRKANTAALALSVLLAGSAVAVGWAQPTTLPRQEQPQPAPGVMGPGMMRGPMMPMMGDMRPMMEMCAQMMNQVAGATAPPAHPEPQTK